VTVVAQLSALPKKQTIPDAPAFLIPGVLACCTWHRLRGSTRPLLAFGKCILAGYDHVEGGAS